MLRRLVFGDVLHVSEVPISSGRTTLRLKLKREKSTGDLYVTLSMNSPGHGDYQYLDQAMFGELVQAVNDTRAAMLAAGGTRP